MKTLFTAVLASLAVASSASAQELVLSPSAPVVGRVTYYSSPAVVAAPTTTYYAPTTTYYAPATTTYYSPAPVTSYYAPVPVNSYYAPVTSYYAAAPVTTYSMPYSAYYAPVAAPYAVGRTTFYYPGQPVRNVLRALAP
jgi:hypothetical protein